jgi:hypothetical protein
MISTFQRKAGITWLDVRGGFRHTMSWKARVKRLFAAELARLFHSGDGEIVLVPYRGGETWLPYPM